MKTLNKILDYTSCIFFSLSLIVLLGCLAVLPIAKSKKYYMKEHQKNGVEEILEHYSFNGKEHVCTDASGNRVEHALPLYDVTNDDIQNATNHIIDYLYHKDVESMQFQIQTTSGPVDFFSEQAIIHMADVKVLFIGGISLAFTCLAIFFLSLGWIIYRRTNVFKLLGKTYFICVSAFVVLTILIVIYASTDFDDAFILFHKIIFPDSEKVDLAISFNRCDTLTNVLTEQFFMDIGLTIGIIFIGLLVVSVAINFVCYKFGHQIIEKWKNKINKEKKVD